MSDRSSRRPRAELTTRKRASIVAAARRLFLARGYAGTGMEEVAAEAAVGIKTVYRHFGGKDDLFQAVIASACDEEDPDRELSWERPVDEALLHAAKVFLSNVLSPDEVALYRAVAREIHRFPNLGTQFFRTLVAGRNERLAMYLRLQHDAGALHVPDATKAATLFAGMLKSGPFEELLFGTRSAVGPHELDEHARSCTHAFLAQHRRS